MLHPCARKKSQKGEKGERDRVPGRENKEKGGRKSILTRPEGKTRTLARCDPHQKKGKKRRQCPRSRREEKGKWFRLNPGRLREDHPSLAPPRKEEKKRDPPDRKGWKKRRRKGARVLASRRSPTRKKKKPEGGKEERGARSREQTAEKRGLPESVAKHPAQRVRRDQQKGGMKGGEKRGSRRHSVRERERRKVCKGPQQVYVVLREEQKKKKSRGATPPN